MSGIELSLDEGAGFYGGVLTCGHSGTTNGLSSSLGIGSITPLNIGGGSANTISNLYDNTGGPSCTLIIISAINLTATYFRTLTAGSGTLSAGAAIFSYATPPYNTWTWASIIGLPTSGIVLVTFK